MDKRSEMLRGKPNSSLSEEEREAKRKLKKALRLQTRIKRLENMMLHAQRRNDPKTEMEAKENMELLMSNRHLDGNTETDFNPWSSDTQISCCCCSCCCCYYSTSQHSKAWILQISERLFRYEKIRLDGLEDPDGIKKLQQTKQTVQLLKHMTKGTQERTMFQEPSALWGYTRQKFFERSMLSCTSLGKLHPCSSVREDPTMVNKVPTHQLELIHTVWKWIIDGNIRQACSFGCGPGNCAVGLLAFLQSITGAWRDTKSDIYGEVFNKFRCSSLERILLFDWAIDDWVKTVLEPLKEILGEERPETIIQWGHFDVSESFTNLRDKNATLHVHRIEDSDVFLISYLLTETRGKWELFFQQLIDFAKQRSMFYLAEPTPWQLHRFKELFHDRFDFIWLDSSMYHPALQSLDGRVGPAVLLGIKK